MAKDASMISDEMDLRREEAIGDDVAKVRSSETHCLERSETRNFCSTCTAIDKNEEVEEEKNTIDEVDGVTHTHVANYGADYIDGKQADKNMLSAASHAFGINRKKSERSNDTSEIAGNKMLVSKRGEKPLDEFHDNHKIVTMAHPTVFLFGTLYGDDTEKDVKHGSLSNEDREHIMNQFTNAAATDPTLTFFMFDQNQRHKNISRKARFTQMDL